MLIFPLLMLIFFKGRLQIRKKSRPVMLILGYAYSRVNPVPVLILATNLLTKKLATEHEFCFRRIITDVTVWRFPRVAYVWNTLIGCLFSNTCLQIFLLVFSEQKTYVWQLHFVTVKKRSYTFQLITRSRTYELIIMSVRKYIP